MSSLYQEVVRFAKEKADEQPVLKRIRLYRGLAVLCGDPETKTELNKLANELDAAERHCREFKFKFGEEGDSK